MALTSVSKVRLLTNITSSQVNDTDMESLIAEATKEIMAKINIKVTRESISYIDGTRQNDIDGSNTTYYIKNWKGNWISDYNYDGSIDTSDITVYAVASDDTETTATVSSITSSEGKFVLDTAYASSYNLYVTYAYTFIDPETPDPLLELACTYLTAAYAYLKRDAGLDGTQKFGNVTINQKLSSSYGEYYNRYKEIMNRLQNDGILKSSWREGYVRI